LDGDGDALGPLFLLALPVSMAAGGALGFYLSSSASDGDPAVSNAVPALLNRSDEGWSMGVPAVGVTPEGVNVWFLGGTF
jgi:hypothetical protein